jgi:nucleotide-binding universal stress UspA family protein
MKTIRKIVAAVDFSESAEPVLEAAVDLAKQFNAALHLVHTFDVRNPLVTPYAVATPPVLVEEARETAEAKLDALARSAAAQGVAAVCHVSGLPAAPAIVKLAEELGADLIVMGAPRHGSLRHVLLGSVCERTLREAPCWVLAVKAYPVAESTALSPWRFLRFWVFGQRRGMDESETIAPQALNSSEGAQLHQP